MYILFPLNNLIAQNYAQKLVTRHDKPDLEMWKFAARYSLLELEVYCRSDPDVFKHLKAIFRDEAKGVSSLARDQIPWEILNSLVRDIVIEADKGPNSTMAWCLRCQKSTTKSCSVCRVKLA